MSPVTRKKRTSNTVGGAKKTAEANETATKIRRPRRKSAPQRLDEIEENVDERADDVLDELNEAEEEAPATLLFESKAVIDKKNGLRFWTNRTKLRNIIASAADYTSSQINASHFMNEVMVTVDPSAERISATGESEFDAGEFYLYDTFGSNTDESFVFSVDANFILTALDIIDADNVTVEMIKSKKHDDQAVLWILDGTDNGQNTKITVGIPDEENRPHVPAGVEDQRIEFDPSAFLAAYTEAERCRAGEDSLKQVFSSIGESEDGRAFIRFSATDQMSAAISRSWVDEAVGDKLKKINFNPDAINKAIPHLTAGSLSRLMVSAENDEWEDDSDDEWDTAQTQQSQLVVLETLDDSAERALSRIKLSTLVPDGNDFEAIVSGAISDALDNMKMLVFVDHDSFCNAIDKADRIHTLNPENEADRRRRVYWDINGDQITVRSHDPKNPNVGTKSVHYIEEVAGDRDSNEDFGGSALVSIVTNLSDMKSKIERFNTGSADGRAVIGFRRNDNDDEFASIILLREEEALAWNASEDAEQPTFATLMMTESLQSGAYSAADDEDDESDDDYEDDFDDEDEEFEEDDEDYGDED